MLLDVVSNLKPLIILALLLGSNTVTHADLHMEEPTTTAVQTVDLLGLPSSIDSNLINERVAAVLDALAKKNMPECDRLIAELKSAAPALPASPIVLARIILQTGDTSQSIAIIEKYLISSPQDPAAYVALADIAVITRRWTEASLLADQAQLLLNANSTLPPFTKAALQFEILGRRADSAMNRQQYALAEECLLKRIELRSNDATSLWVLASVKMQQGDLHAAVDLMNQARKLDPKRPQPELMVALYLATNQQPTAEAWFRKCIEQENATALSWSKYFHWLILQDRSEDLIENYNLMPEPFQTERDVQFLRALAARFEQDLDTAEAIFSALSQKNPDDLEAADQLALVLVESSDESKRARAAQLSEANLRKASQLESIVATAAWIQYKLGAVDVADRMLGALASKISLSPQTAFYASEMLKHRGKQAESRALLDAALKSPGIFVQRKSIMKSLGFDASNPTTTK